MSKFLKLTCLIINVNRINKILISTNPNKYHISLNNKINGFISFSFGVVHTEVDKIDISEEENFIDYNIVSKWINDGFTHLKI